MRIPPLNIDNLLESKPLKSRILVRRLGVLVSVNQTLILLVVDVGLPPSPLMSMCTNMGNLSAIGL